MTNEKDLSWSIGSRGSSECGFGSNEVCTGQVWRCNYREEDAYEDVSVCT